MDPNPKEARKRRKEIMQSLRGDETKEGEQEAEALPPKKRKVSKKESKKTQVRYDPEVPMDKEQLAAWRKEARRVRNRESAGMLFGEYDSFQHEVLYSNHPTFVACSRKSSAN